MRAPRFMIPAFLSSAAAFYALKPRNPARAAKVASWAVTRSARGCRLMTMDAAGGRASAAVAQDAQRREKATATEKLDLQPPKGTRDVYPDDMRLRSWLFGHWRAVARQFAFEEYDAPVLESEALYVRKSGEEVTQQLYNFEDKGGRRVALRPEMTPSLARMIMARRNAVTLPVKWFSIPQCWRYERMTRGRRREHYQWNMDVWGVPGVEGEAELLAAAVAFFRNVGLTSEDVGLKVNSRGVLTELLTTLGIPEERHAATCVLVDKLEKVPIDAIRDDMTALGLEQAVVERVLELMSAKDLATVEAVLGSESKALAELRKLFELAGAYGISDWLTFDASVVRGLAYYTGVVFEGFDRQGQLRAICGGGRYDRLLESFGGEALPACGFGFGDAVIVELLKEKNLLPATSTASVDIVVFSIGEELQPAATAVATKLREAGRSVDLVLEQKKPKWVFRHADRLGAKHVVVVAPDEWANGQVSVKDLVRSEQQLVAAADVVQFLQDK